jgi:hypothetical protein
MPYGRIWNKQMDCLAGAIGQGQHFPSHRGRVAKAVCPCWGGLDVGLFEAVLVGQLVELYLVSN